MMVMNIMMVMMIATYSIDQNAWHDHVEDVEQRTSSYSGYQDDDGDDDDDDDNDDDDDDDDDDDGGDGDNDNDYDDDDDGDDDDANC